MNRPQRILVVFGVAAAMSVGAALPARAATGTSPTTAKTAAKSTAATTTVKAATTAVKSTAVKSTTAKSTAAGKAAASKAPSGKATALDRIAAANAVLATPAAGPGLWRNTSVNADHIRQAAVAALAARGTANAAASRAALAAAVAVATHTTSAAALDRAWATASPARVTAVYTALAQVGTPYQSFGMSPSGFDCSGLTWYAWQAAGVKLPRSSSAQNAALAGVADLAHAGAGDIVWYPGHVEIYLGAGRAMVHSKQRGDVVQVEDITKMARVLAPAA